VTWFRTGLAFEGNMGRGLRQGIFKECESHPAFEGTLMVFDGTSIYSMIPLPENKKISVQVRNRAIETSTVASKPMGVSAEELAPLLNIILKRVLQESGMKRVLDNYFDLTHPLQLEDSNVAKMIRIYTGIASEIAQRVVAGKPSFYLSIDPIHKVVSKDTILSQIMKGENRTEVEGSLKGKRVITTYNFKSYGVEDVDFTKSPKSTFKRTNRKTGEEEEISFVSYYNDMGLQVTDMTQPLLVSTGRQRERIYLLPEFCVAASVPTMAKAKLPALTSLKPTDRIDRFNKLLAMITGEKQKAGDSLKKYGLKVSSEMLSVDKTLLPPPKIVFAPKLEITPSSEWRSQAKNVKYTHVTQRKRVLPVIVTEGFSAEFALEYWDNVKAKLKQMSAPLDFDKELVYKLPKQDWSAGLLAAGDLIKPSKDVEVLILAFLPKDKRRSTVEYDEYRQFCLARGYVGQAIDASRSGVVRKRDPKNKESIITNIARQIVNKFGIQSWWMTLQHVAPKHAAKQFMFVGIDVFHAAAEFVEPKKGQAGFWQKRSIAAYTAKLIIGSTTLHYCTTETRDAGAEIAGQRTQSARPSKSSAPEEAGSSHIREKAFEETALQKFIESALLHWKTYIKPASLVTIVYRDGVADSQLDQVDAAEVSQLKKALPDESHFIYSIVQKRVHNRFVMSDAGKFGNCSAGTVVEDIARVGSRYNFFMVPCLTNLSTNKPVHYTVTYDSHPNVITNQEFHSITFAAHHCYQNWAGTVKVPDVCQYAHKLAYTLGESNVSNPTVPTQLRPTMFYL
jgi:aubergine-like protein